MSKLKKCFLALVLVISMLFSLAACSENKNYEEYQPMEGSMFIYIESYEDPYLGNVKILVDKETRIMYMYAVKNYAACITVIYDSKGEPKKYNGVIKD